MLLNFWRRLMSAARITVKEIVTDLDVSKTRVYEMLDKRIIPNIRVGKSFIVGRHAYEEWKKTIGLAKPAENSKSVLNVPGGLHHVS